MDDRGYRPPYRQGPPPPQQRYNHGQYDQGYNNNGYNNNGRQDHMYDEPQPHYNEYQDEHHSQQQYQSYDNQDQYHEQWNDGQYQEPRYHDQYDQHDQRSQQYDQGLSQSRNYQYDDRYRSNGPGRPTMANTQGRPPPHSGSGRPPPPGDQMRNIPPRGQMGYNHDMRPSPVARERILHKEPESPKTSAWDNPFPAFPSKKKQAEMKRPDIEETDQRNSASGASTQELQRPSTSHSNQQQRADHSPAEPPRPRTSQSQRNFEPFDGPRHVPAMPPRREVPDQRPRTANSTRNIEPVGGPSHMPNMPMRQEPPISRPHTSHSQRSHQPLRSPVNPPEMPNFQNFHADGAQNRSYNDPTADDTQRRPPPRRVMTGPASAQDFGERNQQDQWPHSITKSDQFDRNEYLSRDEDHTQRYPIHPPHNRHDEQTFQEPQVQQENSFSRPPNVNGPSSHRRQSSNQSYDRDQPYGTSEYDTGSYRGVPIRKTTSSDLPNFDAIMDGPTEKVEDHLGLSSQQGQTYQKPIYRSALDPQPSVGSGNDLVSPLSQFSFDLGSKGPSRQNTLQCGDIAPAPVPQDRGYPQPGNYSSRPPPAPLGPGQPMQFTSRSSSRSQEPTPNSPIGYQSNRPQRGIPPVRPGLAQPPPSNTTHEREYQGGYDGERTGYDAGHASDNNHPRPGMPPPQTSYHSDSSRQGYDQRIQPRAEFAHNQGPPRPATSNSTRAGPTASYASRTSSDSYQRPGTQNPDSLPAHPVPFRPGLMQPTPPAPRPTPPPQAYPPPPPPQARPQPQPQLQPQMHKKTPSDAQKPAESPVTVRELNMLREEYKSHPNDYALGLRFAKRLVEAGKVLANEGGRADPKQTAKNRERYILDSHKIVKRLCSSGYAEAMFYMADCYGQGMLGLEVDPKEAFSLYQSAAKMGHAQAAYRVAVCCELGAEEGGGTRRDPLKAVQWYKRAASLGDTPAMYKMGMILLKGLLSQPKSPREAISWLKRAAERANEENPHALHELGLLYENAQPSDIVLKDEHYALELFQQAADLGYKYSQFRLGSAYEYGALNLPIDPRMSIAWYSRAAKQGEHQSEFALSGWYLTGSGQAAPGEQPLLQQSDKEAYLWARKAASSGLAKAEYAMGYYTEVGIGVASNIEEAKRWYYRAAAQNHPKARERLEELKKGGQRMQKTRVSRSNMDKRNEGECVVM